ncbi:hypothetical protein J2778_003806 [Paraburkholderia graminis]|uniref:hypothetical protein n=1 Tax=Paraburkholderia graminis TaxID=60548 RepID=UPI002863CBEC|nr:hypothetical protein [Paraburkholderia graminis]MDR6476306.1 hypothetical protein [Paraburkholderia graminis]
MTKRIFYSWQSDLPNAGNRGFIAKALTAAIKNLEQMPNFGDSEMVEADRPPKESAKSTIALDQATSGTAGAVHIAHTILDKIREADVFVADISTINKGTRKFRKCPNPNVTFELGYAWSILGENRLVLIFNEAETSAAIDIPFDVRGHKYISYNLSATSNPEDRKTASEQLRSKLQSEIASILAADSPRPHELAGMSDSEIRRAHDREVLANVFGHINLDLLDKHIGESPRYLSYSITAMWDEFDRIYSRSGFHIHDEELRKLLAAFVDAWSKSMPGDDFNYYVGMPDPCTERFMSDHEARGRHCESEARIACETLKKGRDALVVALDRLLGYAHAHFPEINPQALGNEVGRSISQEMRKLRGKN